MRKAVVYLFLILGFFGFAKFSAASAAAKTPVSAQPQDPTPVAPPAHLVPENLLAVGNGSIYPPYVFVADKHHRTLSVWKFKNEVPHLVGYYAMGIGKRHGNKEVSGDDKTPQGVYFIQRRLEMANVDYQKYGIRAFTLNYPNFFDRLEGKSGFGIWLHAVPKTESLAEGSEGCVVVRNATIQKLTPYVVLKRTPVVILSKVDYVTPAKLAKERKDALNWLESWRKAWEDKDINAYMSHYAKNFIGQFKSFRMNRHEWRKYKESLNKRYKTIRVVVQDPMVLTHDNQAIFHFIQQYNSSGINDVGEKTLYTERNSAGQYKILSEVWHPLGPDVIQAKSGASLTASNLNDESAAR